MRTSGTYALVISLMVIFLTAAAYMAGRHLELEPGYLEHLLTALTVGGGTFLIVRLFFVRFVEEKVNPIFRTIQSFTLSKKELRKRIDTGDVLADLNQEVKIWATNKTEEIRKLRDMEKYRKDFLGNVSHELKTPIFNIQGYILTLMDGGMEDLSVNELYLKRAEKSINRLINIVEDLDSIARLESGEFTLNKETFNLVKMVEEVIEDQEMRARQRNIRIGFESRSQKSVKVVADRKRIMEVVSNLINNSIKYGRPGGRTTIGFVDTGENILVNVSDNGIGIEERDLPRIFERFYRVDKSRSRESGGTGLGLSIVKHTIQAHNQSITVRSKINKGTTFIFSLEKA